MIEILAIENSDEGGFSPEDRLPDPEDIRVICSSLVSFDMVDETAKPINTDFSDNDSDDSGMQERQMGRVQLAHFSVQEYLLSERCAPRWGFEPQTCHKTMAETCLYYLLHLGERAPLTEEIVRQYPLALYAAKYWWRHAQEVDFTRDCLIFRLASKLLTNEGTAFLVWVQLCNIDKLWEASDLTRTISTVPQPLYYAAFIGLSEVVGSIEQGSVDVNARGGRYGNALQAASYPGHEKVVQMLLDAGADVNAQRGLYGNALQAASGRGHEKVVQMLLDAGADVNAQRGLYGNALQAASGRGHEKVVQMLLDAGANTIP